MLKKPDSNIKIWNETLNRLKKQKTKRSKKVNGKEIIPSMVQHLDDLSRLAVKEIDNGTSN